LGGSGRSARKADAAVATGHVATSAVGRRGLPRSVGTPATERAIRARAPTTRRRRRCFALSALRAAPPDATVRGARGLSARRRRRLRRGAARALAPPPADRVEGRGRLADLGGADDPLGDRRPRQQLEAVDQERAAPLRIGVHGPGAVVAQVAPLPGEELPVALVAAVREPAHVVARPGMRVLERERERDDELAGVLVAVAVEDRRAADPRQDSGLRPQSAL